MQPRTRDRYRQDLENHVIPAFGALRLDEITTKMVKKFLREKARTVINKKTGKKYSRNAVRLMKAAFSVVLSEAVEDGYIPTNPAIVKGGRKRKAGSVKQSERDKAIRPMDVDQRSLFRTASRDLWHGVLFETLVKAGLRPGEAYALLIDDDLDFRSNTISVTKSIEKDSRRVKETKTENHRTVEISPALAETLRNHVASLRKHAMRKGWGELKLLFPSEDNSILDHANVARTFRRVLKKAGLSGFRPYDLRHTYASHALANGAPLTFVAEQMGDSPETVLRYYAKWIPRKGSNLAAQADGSDTETGEFRKQNTQIIHKRKNKSL